MKIKKKGTSYFSEQLRRIMFEQNLTQRELADKINVKQAVISRWLTTDRKPSLSSVKKLATLFNVSWNYFIKDFIEDKDVNADNDNKDMNLILLEKENLKINKEILRIEKEILKEIKDLKNKI